MRCLILTATVSLAFGAASGPALAEAPTPSPVDQSVSLATVALPLVGNGQVANYVFVSVKLLLTLSADAAALRAKEPYFRDALVRAAHRGAPFVRPGDLNRLDDAKIRAVMYHEAVAIAGPGKIAAVAILSQTPEHRRVTPHTAEGAAIVP